MLKYFSITVLCVVSGMAFAQQKERPLPPNINQPGTDLFAPFVSGDGNTLVYLSDYADDGHHTMYWSTRNQREWEDGKEINKLINRPTLNLRGGYSLNYSGDKLYFTSRKSGIGGYDIWMSERNGSDWRAPKNLGVPLNTRSNEGAPSVTADENTMYFMQCETMSEYKVATGCKIMISRKVRGRWQAATELPSNVNTGNSQMPRIMGDDHTLLFASDQFGGKGGLDIFMTRRDGEDWSDPVPVENLNGKDHDAFVSATVKGRYVYRSLYSGRNRELVETLLPPECRSGRVMRIKGTYKGPIEGTLLVFDALQRKRIVNETLEPEQEFSLVLKEGSWYDISIAGNESGYEYFARIDDYSEIGRIDREVLNVKLSPMQEGDTLSSSVAFIDSEANWNDRYVFEMRRMADLLKENNSITLDINLVNPEYIEDTVALSGRYKIRYDTLYKPRIDSLAIYPDPLEANGRNLLASNDSLFIISKSNDTTRVPLSDITIRRVYHNDFSTEQTEAVLEFFESRGIDSTRFTITSVLVKKEQISVPFIQGSPRWNSQADEPEKNSSKSSDSKPPRIIAILRR